jgi:hypothetical protein
VDNSQPLAFGCLSPSRAIHEPAASGRLRPSASLGRRVDPGDPPAPG